MKLKSAASLLAAAVLFALAAVSLHAQTNLETSAHQTEDSNSHYPFSEAIGSLIPLTGIVMGCGLPIVIVVAFFYFNYRKNKIQHETLRAMVEKGVPIPPEMLNRPFSWPNQYPPGGGPRNDLRTGLLLIGLGIGLVLCLGKPGIIILCLGVAFLIAGLFNKKKSVPDLTPKP